MISKTTIDNVYETARLEEVIGDFVQLKKARRVLALLAFKNKKTKQCF